ncbi:DUF1622 domain-containing protein [Streptomyces virginiae]|uniref:DUF1622 domain-containing protein n=1 Tax=Streptomyces virginiae TaxID=1961 RepID=UPI002DD8F8DE|nr:DUF1622 domain-containing protein [Streptomyces virginiae]WSC75461.1 DUF1622 domain-containing protein [Streptomyces virginiae]
MTLPIDLLSESGVQELIGWLVRVIEAAGALIIFAGALWAFARFTSTGLRRRSLIGDFNKIRLSLGRFLVLGLEFQLAGDVLRTAVAPSFTEIGQLAAIAAIRTLLNFFLTREIAEERAEIEQDRKGSEPRLAAP